jgi:uncharacterized membrane-anchored protein YhcB (DUF1043 family)
MLKRLYHEEGKLMNPYTYSSYSKSTIGFSQTIPEKVYRIKRREGVRMSTIKNIFSANKNAKQNEQLRKSNTRKLIAGTTGTGLGVAGTVAGFFFARHEKKKAMEGCKDITQIKKDNDELKKQNEALNDAIKQISEVVTKLEKKQEEQKKNDKNPDDKTAQKPEEKTEQNPDDKTAQKPEEKTEQNPDDKTAQNPDDKTAQKPEEKTEQK